MDYETDREELHRKLSVPYGGKRSSESLRSNSRDEMSTWSNERDYVTSVSRDSMDNQGLTSVSDANELADLRSKYDVALKQIDLLTRENEELKQRIGNMESTLRVIHQTANKSLKNEE